MIIITKSQRRLRNFQKDLQTPSITIKHCSRSKCLLCYDLNNRRQRLLINGFYLITCCMFIFYFITKTSAPAAGGQTHLSLLSSGTNTMVPSFHQIKSINPRNTLYSKLRIDRAGSVIQDMMIAAAFAFTHNLTYGGACEESLILIKNKSSNEHNAAQSARVLQIMYLIRSLGLEKVLPLKCPPPKLHIRLWDREHYTSLNTAVFTKDFLAFVQAERILYTESKSDEHDELEHEIVAQRLSNNHNEPSLARVAPTLTTQISANISAVHDCPRIVLHIRRGDVSPCSSNYDILQRYLSNAYFQKVLEHYILRYPTIYNHSLVTIYSESESLEPWNSFFQRYNANNESITTTFLKSSVSEESSSQAVPRMMVLQNATYHFRHRQRHHAKVLLDSTVFRLQIMLDTNLLEAWKDMITADVLVLSKSSFSLLPALLHTAADSVPITAIATSLFRHDKSKQRGRTVLYTPFWYDPLPQWEIIDFTLQAKEKEFMKKVQQKYCTAKIESNYGL